jgi:hypothetical protein
MIWHPSSDLPEENQDVVVTMYDNSTVVSGCYVMGEFETASPLYIHKLFAWSCVSSWIPIEEFPFPITKKEV